MSKNRSEGDKALASDNIRDAMELLGLRRSVIPGFTFLAPPGSVLVGPALTVRQVSKHGSTSRSAKLVRHVEVSDYRAQRSDVIFIDVGGNREVCFWGGIQV